MLFNNSLIGSTFIKQIPWEGTETEGKKIGQAALEKLPWKNLQITTSAVSDALESLLYY